MRQWARGLSIEDVVADLQWRMARVERQIGLAEAEPAESERAEPEPVAQPEPPEVAAAPQPAVLPPPLPVQPLSGRSWSETWSETRVAAPVVPQYEPSVPVAAVAQTELEQTIGLKWAGWIGAVVLVFGAAFGIKYAYDQQWFDVLPPAARLLLMSFGGIALLAAGEVVYRRIQPVAAACLFGAGVATLFLVSYAGHAYYRLYEPQTAFVLMGLTTAVGAAVAMRGNLLSIAVLSQVGGNLAPALLHTDRPMFGSEERRVGKESLTQCRSRWSPYH